MVIFDNQRYSNIFQLLQLLQPLLGTFEQQTAYSKHAATHDHGGYPSTAASAAAEIFMIIFLSHLTWMPSETAAMLKKVTFSAVYMMFRPITEKSILLCFSARVHWIEREGSCLLKLENSMILKGTVSNYSMISAT